MKIETTELRDTISGAILRDILLLSLSTDERKKHVDSLLTNLYKLRDYTEAVGIGASQK